MIVGTSLSLDGGGVGSGARASSGMFRLSAASILALDTAAYNGLTAVLVNLLLATALSLVLRSRAVDETSPQDYDDRVLA